MAVVVNIVLYSCRPFTLQRTLLLLIVGTNSTQDTKTGGNSCSYLFLCPKCWCCAKMPAAAAVLLWQTLRLQRTNINIPSNQKEGYTEHVNVPCLCSLRSRVVQCSFLCFHVYAYNTIHWCFTLIIFCSCVYLTLKLMIGKSVVLAALHSCRPSTCNEYSFQPEGQAHKTPKRADNGHKPMSTHLEPQSRFGDKPLKFQEACPQDGTAVLNGLSVSGYLLAYQYYTNQYSILNHSSKLEYYSVAYQVLEYQYQYTVLEWSGTRVYLHSSMHSSMLIQYYGGP